MACPYGQPALVVVITQIVTSDIYRKIDCFRCTLPRTFLRSSSLKTAFCMAVLVGFWSFPYFRSPHVKGVIETKAAYITLARVLVQVIESAVSLKHSSHLFTRPRAPHFSSAGNTIS